MSCNLDHVLYDKQNSMIKSKKMMRMFCKKYKGKVEAFKEFICKSPFSVTGDYKGSGLLKKDLNSESVYTICVFVLKMSWKAE